MEVLGRHASRTVAVWSGGVPGLERAACTGELMGGVAAGGTASRRACSVLSGDSSGRALARNPLRTCYERVTDFLGLVRTLQTWLAVSRCPNHS